MSTNTTPHGSPDWFDTLEEPRYLDHASVGGSRSRHSRAVRDLKAVLPSRSWSPGGARRHGQRSGDRRIPIPESPVAPELVLSVFTRRWHGKFDRPLPWRIRGLAVIAVAMSVARGTTVPDLCALLPRDVLALAMPAEARRWVVRWVRTRRVAMGASSETQPWLTFARSRGMPRQIGWSVCQTFHRAKLPG